MDTAQQVRGRGRPATGQMPKRYFRMDDKAYELVQAAADAKGEDVSKYIRRVLLKDAERVAKRK